MGHKSLMYDMSVINFIECDTRFEFLCCCRMSIAPMDYESFFTS